MINGTASISKLLAGYLLAILMSITAAAQSDYGTGAAVTVPYVPAGEITLDGTASEAAWTKARVIDPLAHVDQPYAHKGFTLPDDVSAEARLLFSDGAVYLFVEVQDSEQYTDPAAAYNSDVILVGVDLLHQAGVTDLQADPSFAGFVSNAPGNGPVVYQALPGSEILLGWAPGPVQNGWVEGQAFSTATSWGVEMAIYGDEIGPDSEIGLNVGAFIAKEAGVGERNNGEGGFDYTYAFASWQICDDPEVWCGAGGTILGASHSFATAAGDGNGDGNADIAQSNVASIRNGTDGEYLTFESPDGTSLLDVEATDTAPAEPPTEASFPAGFVSFGVSDVDVGGQATVTIRTHKTVTGYWKHGPEGWYDFEYDPATGRGAEIFPDRVVLHLQDGELGDGDEVANGFIQDPGAPVFQVASAIDILREHVNASGLNADLKNALLSKLANAAKSYRRGRTNAAAGQLGAFINEVKDITGQDLSETDAEVLVAYAEAAVDALGDARVGKAAVTAASTDAPQAFTLEGNYPNPFNPQTSIGFSLAEPTQVRLAVYDALGRQVKVLVDRTLEAGTHQALFDASNLASGTYIYRIEMPQGVKHGSMVLMK